MVFHVTINYVGEMPELTDELAKKLSYGQYDTVEAYEQSIRDEIESGYAEDHQNALYTAIMEKLAEIYPVEEIPEENVEYEVKRMLNQFTHYAAMYGMKTENFIQSFYGMTQDEFVEQELRPQTENTLIQEIILSAIATKEDITVSDKELDKELDDLSKQTGSSVEELMGDMSREDIRSYLQQEKVLKWLSNNVTIEEVEETESLDAFGNETEAETAAVSETEAETEEAAEVTAQTEAADENKAETETEEA